MYLTYPRIGAAERAAVLREMVRAVEVVELAVGGRSRALVRAGARSGALAAAGRRRAASRGATLLSPFELAPLAPQAGRAPASASTTASR